MRRPGATGLRKHPYMGRAGRAAGTLELVISHTYTVAVYRFIERARRVEILRLLHGNQEWRIAGHRRKEEWWIGMVRRGLSDGQVTHGQSNACFGDMQRGHRTTGDRDVTQLIATIFIWPKNRNLNFVALLIRKPHDELAFGG